MTASTKEKRLDVIEIYLTPKEWAIRLAHEMRAQPAEADFVRIIADEEYREWGWVKPFFKLCEQAEARYPGRKPENIRARNQFAGRLRTEFHALKKLIFKANEIIRSKTETIALKTGLKLLTLQTLILQDAIGRTTTRTAEWIEHCKTADAGVEEERQLILRELAGYMQLSVPLGQTCSSLIEDWADELVMLLMDVFAHKAVVREIQEQYFDGHSILFCDAEAKLAGTIKSIGSAVSMFNEYLSTRDALFKSEAHSEDAEGTAASELTCERAGHWAIDVGAIRDRAEEFLVDHIADKWMKESRENAKADILQETGEHEGHIWQTFRERVQR